MARRGAYFDAFMEPFTNLSPFKDWLACTLFSVVAAGFVGWMVSMFPVVLLWPSHFNPDDAGQFGLVYLVSIAVWVVPSSLYWAYVINRTIRHKRRVMAVLDEHKVWIASQMAQRIGLSPKAARRVLDQLFNESALRGYSSPQRPGRYDRIEFRR